VAFQQQTAININAPRNSWHIQYLVSRPNPWLFFCSHQSNTIPISPSRPSPKPAILKLRFKIFAIGLNHDLSKTHPSRLKNQSARPNFKSAHHQPSQPHRLPTLTG